jgi:hypothetical protein
MGEWPTAPTRLPTEGRTVHIDGYRRQPVSTVEVLGLNSAKIVLLVVSPHANPDQAHAIMMTAAGSGNASTVQDLLMTSAADG